VAQELEREPARPGAELENVEGLGAVDRAGGQAVADEGGGDAGVGGAHERVARDVVGDDAGPPGADAVPLEVGALERPEARAREPLALHQHAPGGHARFYRSGPTC